jgi:hypothetical protein
MDPSSTLVVEILGLLGVNYPSDLQAIERMPFEQGTKVLADLKERVRKGYKRLAFELHPDRTGNDPEKTERFKLLAQIRDRIEKITIQQRQPPPQIQIRPPQPGQQVIFMRVPMGVIFRHPAVTMNVQGKAGNQTSTTHFGPGGPAFVAKMRPT